jgi:hypothetical protein
MQIKYIASVSVWSMCGHFETVLQSLNFFWVLYSCSLLAKGNEIVWDEADKVKMVREYRAQLDPERAQKLANAQQNISFKVKHILVFWFPYYKFSNAFSVLLIY